VNLLIAIELRNADTKPPHRSLQSLPEPTFSGIAQKDIDRIANGKKRQGGIDLSRYEAPDEPSTDDAEVWRQALRTAYTSTAYLSGRHINLALLEELGKNAWLIGNAQLDEMLKSLDMEWEQLKQETELINRERKLMQEVSRGEVDALEETWKRGIGRLIEVQLATEASRKELRSRG
jgi:pre-mRNA-splicing factor SPF27